MLYVSELSYFIIKEITLMKIEKLHLYTFFYQNKLCLNVKNFKQNKNE